MRGILRSQNGWIGDGGCRQVVLGYRIEGIPAVVEKRIRRIGILGNPKKLVLLCRGVDFMQIEKKRGIDRHLGEIQFFKVRVSAGLFGRFTFFPTCHDFGPIQNRAPFAPARAAICDPAARVSTRRNLDLSAIDHSATKLHNIPRP